MAGYIGTTNSILISNEIMRWEIDGRYCWKLEAQRVTSSTWGQDLHSFHPRVIERSSPVFLYFLSPLCLLTNFSHFLSLRYSSSGLENKNRTQFQSASPEISPPPSSYHSSEVSPTLQLVGVLTNEFGFPTVMNFVSQTSL